MVIVTGGTKGIGRAIVERFAALGYDILTCSRSEKDLNSLKYELEKRFDSKIHTFKADFEHTSEVQQFLEFIQQFDEKIDALVNNVGFFVPSLFSDNDEILFEKMMQVNFFAAKTITQSLVPVLKKQQSGHIFTICSADTAHRGNYTLSKAALERMSKVLSAELRSFRVRVTAIKLGATNTPSWDGVEIDKSKFISSKDVAELIASIFQTHPTAIIDELLIQDSL